MTELPRAQSADIALLLEGTYPYISGGVSSWVHQIITGFPDLTFAVVFLGSRPEDYGPIRYKLPPNLVHVEAHYIFDAEDRPAQRTLRTDPAAFAHVKALHRYWQDPENTPAGTNPQALFGAVIDRFDDQLGEAHFLRGDQAWEHLCAQYEERCTDPSFVDYFWTVRTMHAPLWKLKRIADRLIPVKAFHTVSTGYAGLLGAMCKRKHGRSLVLSEHGIYTKERKIDLFGAHWIADNRSVLQRDLTELSYFRDLWIRFFQGIGKACYESSDQIIALYEANRRRQVADGARGERTSTVPNGIDIARFAPLRALRPAKVPQVLCLIGRVVPIKDVKTYIRALRSVVNQLPEAEGWIAGPENEDPAYAEECKLLIASLGLQDRVRFLGFQQLTELLPKVGLVVLSSISEALPLVLLEGFAAGVPAVSTDVGSCRQLIEGLDDEDRALGPSGRVVGLADPKALADAAVELLSDSAAWQRASDAGVERVQRYYSLERMLGRYRAIYERALTWQASVSS
ncbi:GT4 family glycosyltransferase PelF [uncultured Sphaerotilus sp.]|uniref:GT4 family glycosyltransferase PelF n=1 Tax=uncultured Sphaerotilus sp. TaxID=474984 RepID=UPI0030CA39BB